MRVGFTSDAFEDPHMSTELVDSVREALSVSPEEFAATVEREAANLKSELQDGTFDNPQAIVGLEYELYGAAAGDCSLRRMPRPLLELISFEEELGLHNAEFHTNPQPFDEYGFEAQLTEVQSRLQAAQNETRAEQIRLVSDGLWTVPPAGESARTYLTDSVEHDGVQITANMADDTRYLSMGNGGTCEPQRHVETPNADFASEVVMPEADEHVELLRTRIDEGTTPARWKRETVRRRVDGGATLAGAIEEMQTECVERQSETLVDGTFREWLAE